MLYFLSFWFILILVALVGVSVQFFNFIFRGYAPMIPSHRGVLKMLADNIRVNAGDKVYELGCGDAGFLRALEQKYPQATFIGIENNFLSVLVTKMQLAVKKSKIMIRQENIFTADFRDADLIYCYLGTSMTPKLGPIIKANCKPGTQLISLSFAFPTLTPDKIETAEDRKIFFYTL
jgi:hypothetical protein